jgi:alanine racemase
MPTRPCWVEIQTRSFEENYRFLAASAAPHAQLLAIVKADAYGHGIAICAPAAVKAGAQWLGVTSVEEGVAARGVCPGPQILVISGVFRGQGAAALGHRLTPVAWEPWHLDELEVAGRAASAAPGSIRVHLEIDTGMSRQGVSPANLAPLLARFKAESPLKLDGVMTHLFAADESDGSVTAEQMTRLQSALEQVKTAGLRPSWLNVGNSAASLTGHATAIGALAAHYGMKALLRPGLALYGLVPEFNPEFAGDEPSTLAAARTRLQPVLSWKTQVVGVRAVPAGTVVGYNGTFVATEPMQLALLAAGYGDGLDRKLGNRFSLLVQGQRAPLVGRISMDQAVLDVTGIDGVKTGDAVVIIGSQDGGTITAFDHAHAAGTVPWEIFTRIAERVPRVAL